MSSHAPFFLHYFYYGIFEQQRQEIALHQIVFIIFTADAMQIDYIKSKVFHSTGIGLVFIVFVFVVFSVQRCIVANLNADECNERIKAFVRTVV